MQLTAITSKISALMDLIELEGTGEIPAELLELENMLADKADELGELILTKESEIADLKTIGNSYLERAKAKKSQLDLFKGFLANVVSKFGKDEISKSSGKTTKWLRGKLVGIKDSSKWEVKVLDEEKIPAVFKTANVSVKCSVSDGLKVIKKLLPLKEIEVDTKQTIDKKKLDEHILTNGFDLEGTQKIYENKILITGYKKAKNEEN